MKFLPFSAIAFSHPLTLRIFKLLQKTQTLLTTCIFLGVITACSPSQTPSINLSLQLEPTGRPGVYLASGTTNLPDRSRLVVSGIRYLQPTAKATVIRPDNANYAILDQEVVEVNQSKWQTTLNLWQVASDGSYQESWQRQQKELGLSYNSSGQVVFVATFEPDNQIPNINKQVSKNTLQPPLLRFTSSGQPYLQVNQSLAVSLPFGKTDPPITSAKDVNDGWGNRSTLRPQPLTKVTIAAPPKEKLNDAPLPPSALMR